MAKTQFKLIDRRKRGMADVEQFFGRMTEIRTEFYRRIAEIVIQASPVSTGTYMDSHNIYAGKSSQAGMNSSRGKPRTGDYETHSSQAEARLFSQIEALGDAKSVYIGNDAMHANAVEYGAANMPGGYAPYTIALGKGPGILRELLAELAL